MFLPAGDIKLLPRHLIRRRLDRQHPPRDHIVDKRQIPRLPPPLHHDRPPVAGIPKPLENKHLPPHPRPHHHSGSHNHRRHPISPMPRPHRQLRRRLGKPVRIMRRKRMMLVNRQIQSPSRFIPRRREQHLIHPAGLPRRLQQRHRPVNVLHRRIARRLESQRRIRLRRQMRHRAMPRHIPRLHILNAFPNIPEIGMNQLPRQPPSLRRRRHIQPRNPITPRQQSPRQMRTPKPRRPGNQNPQRAVHT